MVAAVSQPDFARFRSEELAGHYSQINTLDWSCSGDSLGTGSDQLLLYKLHPSGLVQTSSLEKGKPYSQSLTGVGTTHFYLVWHPSEPDRLLSLDDQGIRFWDARSAKITSSVTVQGVKKLLYAVWTPSGHEVLATTSSNLNMIVDVRMDTITDRLPNSIEVNQAAISPDGKTVLQGWGNGHIAGRYRISAHLYISHTMNHLAWSYPSRVRSSYVELQSHNHGLKKITRQPLCRYFLSGSHDSTLTVWDFETLVPIKSHYNYDSAINDASFSHDSQFVALGGEEQTIKINHTTTGALAHKISCRGLPFALSWNPRHMLLAYSGRQLPPSRPNQLETGVAYVDVFSHHL